ncbi:MAG: urate hydroxylase PuuD [Cellvibrionaceae bacterium]
MQLVDFFARWGHTLFGITWIGMLYYFNFVQGAYFKEAGPEALSDAKAKLAPRALWWFRWGAMFTFITGVILLVGLYHQQNIDSFIIVGALLGTLMFLNVWLVIWPNQKVALGMKEGDGPAAGAKALLASRTNTLFSVPMAYGMLASTHGFGPAGFPLANSGASLGLWIAIALIAALEVNALVGKQGPMTSVAGVIHSSLALTVVIFAVLHFL